MSEHAMLELTDVTRRYADTEVLRGVSLQVERRTSLAIVGPSGSGKSTLLNVMGALDQPSGGRVTLDGDDLANMSPDALASLRNRSIGFVFQSHHLLPQCTALENVLVPTLVGGRGSDDPVDRARHLLAQVGLGDRLSHRPGQLSGGECQRVAVVRAVINRPKLLLADEPTGSLDGAAADGVVDLLSSLNEEEGGTLVVVTHSTAVAARMDRMLLLVQGRLEATEVLT